jgi:hypothetical protein
MKMTAFILHLAVLSMVALGCTNVKSTVNPLSQSAAAEIKKSIGDAKVANPSLMASEEQQLGKEALGKEYDLTIEKCRTLLTGYEDKAEWVTYTRIGLGLVGSVAGGVVIPALSAAAPIANKAAISSLGGLSGITSGVLGGMGDGGLTPAHILMARQESREEIFKALKNYYKLVGDNKSIEAGVVLDEVRAICTLYKVTVPGSNK